MRYEVFNIHTLRVFIIREKNPCIVFHFISTGMRSMGYRIAHSTKHVFLVILWILELSPQTEFDFVNPLHALFVFAVHTENLEGDAGIHSDFYLYLDAQKVARIYSIYRKGFFPFKLPKRHRNMILLYFLSSSNASNF